MAPAGGSIQETPSTTTTTTTVAAGEGVVVTPKEDEPTPNPTPATTTTTQVTEGQDVVDEIPPLPATKPISEDPRYAHYFRMLKMGVPDPAVRMKMSSEGVDPSLLE